MCDQPSLHYALYLLVQIFAKYENLPMDLYGLIDGEIRKLYYREEKNVCITQLKIHIDHTLERYEKEKKDREDTEVLFNRLNLGGLSYIMPMRFSLIHKGSEFPGYLQRLENVIVDDTYYINGFKIYPYDWRNDNGFWKDVHKKGYGFDIHSKEDYVSLLDNLDSEEYYNSFEDSYYISPHGNYNILKKIIRNQMVLEECRIQIK